MILLSISSKGDTEDGGIVPASSSPDTAPPPPDAAWLSPLLMTSLRYKVAVVLPVGY